MKSMKSNTLDSLAATLAVLLPLLTTLSAGAGTITLVTLPATSTDLATGISPGKHYVCVFDYGNNGSPPSAINGVPVTHFDPGNQVVNLTNIVDANFGGQAILSSGPPNGSSSACKLARTSNSGQGSLASQADGNMFALLTEPALRRQFRAGGHVAAAGV